MFSVTGSPRGTPAGQSVVRVLSGPETDSNGYLPICADSVERRQAVWFVLDFHMWCEYHPDSFPPPSNAG